MIFFSQYDLNLLTTSIKEQTNCKICAHQYGQLWKRSLSSVWFLFGPKEVKVVSSYFRASAGSLVPDRLTELRAWAQLKNCLKDEGISLHFLPESEEKRLKINLATWMYFFFSQSVEVCEPFAVSVRTCERRRSLTCWGQKDASEILWAEMHTPKNKKHKKLSKKDGPVSVCCLWNVTNQTELRAGHNRRIKNAFI